MKMEFIYIATWLVRVYEQYLKTVLHTSYTCPLCLQFPNPAGGEETRGELVTK